MPGHKFKIGDRVRCRPSTRSFAGDEGVIKSIEPWSQIPNTVLFSSNKHSYFADTELEPLDVPSETPVDQENPKC